MHNTVQHQKTLCFTLLACIGEFRVQHLVRQVFDFMKTHPLPTFCFSAPSFSQRCCLASAPGFVPNPLSYCKGRGHSLYTRAEQRLIRINIPKPLFSVVENRPSSPACSHYLQKTIFYSLFNTGLKAKVVAPAGYSHASILKFRRL